MSNLLNVDSLISLFLKEREVGINALYQMFVRDNNQLNKQAIYSELSEELKNGCISFINKNYPLEEINIYLFYIANSFMKKNNLVHFKKCVEYLCPGCLFLGEENIIKYYNLFRCEACEEEYKLSIDAKKATLCRIFSKHNKNGYRCADCKRFIPHPLDSVKNISCPYLDCCFVGDYSLLKKMNHPTKQFNPEKLVLDNVNNNFSMKDLIISNEISAQSKIEIEEEFKNKVKLIKDIIDYQNNNVMYSGADFTVKHKTSVYHAFNNLLDKFPAEMVDYLLNNSRSGGFQHKIFQEYICLLEKSLPFVFKKNNKVVRIDSLLDENLSLFDGISIFDNFVDEHGNIKNNTKEFYIGGRKAAYTKPYYIGKLLSLIDKKSKATLINNVTEYSFSKIKTKDIAAGTIVTVSHLRVPPHYQMGGMVYINRIRKKIIDRAIYLSKEPS